MNFLAGVQQASKFASAVRDRCILENDQVMLMLGREICRQRNHFLNKLKEAKLTVKLVREDCHCL